MLLALVIGWVNNWLDIVDKGEPVLLVIYILSVLLFVNYYRVKQFTSIDNGKAGWLSAFVVGLGHVYSQKKTLGYILVILHFVVYFSAINMEDRTLIYVWIGLTVLSVMHANMTASKMNDKLAKQSLQKLAVMKYRNLKASIKPGTVIAPDTNILMHEQLTLVAAFRDSDLKLYISKQVMKELDGLKNNDSPGTRKSAQLGFDILEMYQEAGRVVFMEIPHHNYLKQRHLTGGPDEKIIASCLELLEKNVPIVFVSNDKGARILARNSKMPTLSI
ncbi:PIN domain-containing protein [Oceanobacillus limi]|uniref:PIN domain-containing protein n=1 Tax=Oceanobacillus limi TaxID=930131 RepID=A0A1I0A7X5_9BACI|nr:PIN domain-containing protein [Oceanobacillus limi]SES90269.1 PIN domain-containing protein [Oceanobacillus limi]